MSIRQFLKKVIATPGVKKWFFKKSGYNQYGLYRDDLYHETPEVLEAVRRLPPDVADARNYRILRAHQLSLTHTILPENEWTKFEDDENNRYLKPLLDQVEGEKKEREIWAKTH